MHDLTIRNASIIDGSGKAGFQGDVAVDGDRITAVEPAGTLTPVKKILTPVALS